MPTRSRSSTATREACHVVRDGLAQSRRVGNRYWELSFLGQLYPFFAAGEWDEALAMFAELPLDEWEQSRVAFVVGPMIQAGIGAHRGTLGEARGIVERFRVMETSGDVYEKAASTCAQAFLMLADGDLARGARPRSRLRLPSSTTSATGPRS